MILTQHKNLKSVISIIPKLNVASLYWKKKKMNDLCMNKDILIEIPTQDLPELAKLYENVSWAPYSTCVINTAIRWRKEKPEHPNAYIVYSPNNSWRKDGTFIVAINVASKNIFISTLDEKCETLYHGVKALLPQNHSQTFFAIHEKFIGTCYRVFKEYELQFDNIGCRMLVMPPDEAANLKVECPENFYIKPLDYAVDAEKINSVWPHRYKDSEKFVSLLIKENGGYGLYDKKTNELAAWILRELIGNVGLLQTDEKYQRLGLGQVITKVLSREIGEEGHWPYGTIVTKNIASQNMFQKINFKDIGYCTFLYLKNK